MGPFLDATGGSMKDILLFLCPFTRRDSLSGGGHYAIALARRYGAHLSTLIADVQGDFGDLPLEPDLRQVERDATKPASLSERTARTAQFIHSAAKDAGVSCDILETESQSVSLRERMIHCTQVHDVL